MSSLVAYEDSESEDDHLDQTEEETSASVQTAPREHNQEVRMCKSSEITPRPHNLTSDADGSVVENIFESRSFLLPPHSQPQSRLDSESNYSRDGPAQGNNFRDAAAPLSLPMSQGKSSPRQTLPHMTQRFGDGLNPAKRNPTVRSGVRPYIPKRQRLAPSVGTADPTYPAEQDPGSLTRDSHMISDVSARIKPYLSHKPGAAGIPRRLLMSLGGHQGPVNTVRWCPVPHLSHLLLSASMDKTFKVWDGVESGRCLRVYTCHSGAVRDARWTPCGRHLLSGSFDNKAAITDAETGQQVVKLDNQFKVMCVAPHPSSPEVLLCGGYSSTVKAWDSRSCKVVKEYKAGIQQTLDILFLRGGVDFITSSDCVSRDSADRTLIAWDYRTTAKVSNQIYQVDAGEHTPRIHACWTGAIHVPQPGAPPPGGGLCCPDQRGLHGRVLLPEALQDEQEAEIRGSQGGGIRGAVRVLSGRDHPGLGELLRLGSLLRLPRRSCSAHAARPQPALPGRRSASHPACHRRHLRLGRGDQGLALRTEGTSQYGPKKTKRRFLIK
ncbi:WD repeat-containing protein 25 isoform X1 [Pseudoliparis swirei]|uniref:WD repeat-containing protein 25 isoform X1 n=1 Tax=Pseudoliparis swirei TaxID=2059687 RepID=UPI0024BE2C52|nr:WD repeat-containing protein 25 isoform X1 [Pseudoliparis swirei]